MNTVEKQISNLSLIILALVGSMLFCMRNKKFSKPIKQQHVDAMDLNQIEYLALSRIWSCFWNFPAGSLLNKQKITNKHYQTLFARNSYTRKLCSCSKLIKLYSKLKLFIFKKKLLTKCAQGLFFWKYPYTCAR